MKIWTNKRAMGIVSGLLVSQICLAAALPSNDCQRVALNEAKVKIPSGAVITDISSYLAPEGEQDRSLGQVIIIGRAEHERFSIAVDVNYGRTSHTCSVQQVEGLSWEDPS